MKLFTIGFTKKSAEQFFTALQAAGVQRLIDVRLNNTSQLAGFSKRDDLQYLLRAIAGIPYSHLPELAPTDAILDAYKKKQIEWPVYEERFRSLLNDRRSAETLDATLFANACLLCSEEKPDHCHRRLVAEHLAGKWPNVEIVHL